MCTGFKIAIDIEKLKIGSFTTGENKPCDRSVLGKASSFTKENFIPKHQFKPVASNFYRDVDVDAITVLPGIFASKFVGGN